MVSELTQLLSLTDAQLQSWQTIRSQAQSTIDPLRQQAMQLRDEIRQMLDGTSPDAATVGAKMISLAGIEAQIKTAADAADTAFKALLTTEQQATFAIFKQIQDARRTLQPPRPTDLPAAEVTLVTQMLALTDAQQQSWLAIRTQVAASLDTLQPQIDQARTEIATLLAGSSPDATVVGQKAVALKALETQVQTTVDAGNDAFKALLSTSQAAIWTVYVEMQKLTPPGPPPGGPGGPH